MKTRRSPLLLAFLALAAGALAESAPAQTANPLRRALNAQRRLVAERPNDPGPINDLGNLLFEMGRAEAAEEAYRRALQLDPHFVPARFNLALLLQRDEEHGKALRQLKRLLATDPDHAWGHYQTGRELARSGNTKRAAKHYAKAFRLDPSLLEPTVNPHIVANELSTRAVLMAFRSTGERTTAPRQYENAGRIARLLVPRPSGPEPETAGAPPPQKPKKRQRKHRAQGSDSGQH